MTLTRDSRCWFLLVLGLSACPKPAPAAVPPVDAGPVDAGPPPDAGPQPIPGARLTAWVDGGLALALDAGAILDAAPTQSAARSPTSDAGVTTADDAGSTDAGPIVAAVVATGPTKLDLTLPDASVPDTTAIVFEADVPLDDARFRLLTDDDRFVPNHADIAIGAGADGGTKVVLTPTTYWPPQGCCRFVVDGDAEHLPTGTAGRYLRFETHFGVLADANRLQAAIVAKQRSHRKRHRR